MKCKVILKTDEEFRSLMPPSSRQEYEQLEQDILQHGCKEPIFAWGSLILDGNKRFEICTRHQLPFETIQVALAGRLEAMSWICTAALSKVHMSIACRRYLIGKKFLLETEMASKRNHDSGDSPARRFSKISICRLIGSKYGIHPRTIYGHARYAAALDRIRSVDHDLAESILAGRIKILAERLSAMSSCPLRNVKALCRDIAAGTAQAATSVKPSGMKRICLPANAGEIKNMPIHDPDAALRILSLTMPTWVSSIRRVTDCLTIDGTTEDARLVLANELKGLLQASLALSQNLSRGAVHAGR
jgi:hypothetical protein